MDETEKYELHARQHNYSLTIGKEDRTTDFINSIPNNKSFKFLDIGGRW